MSQKDNNGVSMNFKSLNNINNKYVKIYDDKSKLSFDMYKTSNI